MRRTGFVISSEPEFCRRLTGWFGLVLGVAAVAGVPRAALACGAGAGGAAGISGCSLEEHEEAARLKWRVGAGYAFTATALHFSGGLRVDEVRHSSVVSLDYRAWPKLTLQVSAGAFDGGSITVPGARYDLDPGFAGSLGGSWRLVDPDGALPFVLVTGQVSFVSSGTEPGGPYDAFDVRLGPVVGMTLWRVLTPYVAARAFGGPVFWRFAGAAVVGTDAHHWQVGGGFSLRLGRRVDLFGEGAPLGELGVAAGAGVSL